MGKILRNSLTSAAILVSLVVLAIVILTRERKPDPQQKQQLQAPVRSVPVPAPIPIAVPSPPDTSEKEMIEVSEIRPDEQQLVEPQHDLSPASARESYEASRAARLERGHKVFDVLEKHRLTLPEGESYAFAYDVLINQFLLAMRWRHPRQANPDFEGTIFLYVMGGARWKESHLTEFPAAWLHLLRGIGTEIHEEQEEAFTAALWRAEDESRKITSLINEARFSQYEPKEADLSIVDQAWAESAALNQGVFAELVETTKVLLDEASQERFQEFLDLVQLFPRGE